VPFGSILPISGNSLQHHARKNSNVEAGQENEKQWILDGMAKGSLAMLATALSLLAVGELAGSFALLAIASSAVVLTCVFAVPLLAARVILRPTRK
jgi:hypothetical protein